MNILQQKWYKKQYLNTYKHHIAYHVHSSFQSFPLHTYRSMSPECPHKNHHTDKCSGRHTHFYLTNNKTRKSVWRTILFKTKKECNTDTVYQVTYKSSFYPWILPYKCVLNVHKWIFNEIQMRAYIYQICKLVSNLHNFIFMTYIISLT